MSDQLQFEDEDIPITLRRAWDRALRSLASRVNKPTFETHIRAIRPLALAEETEGKRSVFHVTLGVPSMFTREWVEKRHTGLIQGILEDILDRDVRVQFVLTPRDKAAPVPKVELFDTPATPKPSKANIPLEPGEGDFQLFADTTPTTAAPSTAPALPADPASSPQATQNAPAAPAARPRAAKGSKSEAGSDGPALNSKYTFDNFVTGSSNRLAEAGARAVAQAPGMVYNPLFLYGPSGLGKTHLMHAIGNEIAHSHGGDPGRVAYISGESFTTNYIASLRDQSAADAFRRRWRSVDVWMVDDIQFIAGKERTKEEFFHTFNALYQTGKQIVISSDRSPRELRAMDERLRSRFESGLIADISPPDLETRLAILHRKAEIERMRIPDDVLLYMARLVQSNIRTLEGALVKLIAYASLANSPVTTQLAAQILERYYIAAGVGNTDTGDPPPSGPQVCGRGGGERQTESPPPGDAFATFAGGLGTTAAITPELVQQVVARRFGLTPDALTGKKRDREVAQARQIAMLLMRDLTEMSLPGIGQLFGGRDHSTVVHSVDKMRSQIPLDDDLKSLVSDLMMQIRAQASA